MVEEPGVSGGGEEAVSQVEEGQEEAQEVGQECPGDDQVLQEGHGHWPLQFAFTFLYQNGKCHGSRIETIL